MPLHESSINFRKLIQDLADMYPFDVSEVVLSELIANALDAKANKIKIDYNPKEKILVVEDNGAGMTSDQFDEYHDFAAGLKRRGTGIGFAGLGAKISFNIADRVITETKSRTFKGGSSWYLQSNKKLVWEEVLPENIKVNGTRVEVHFFKNSEIIYKSKEELFRLLIRQYLPLLIKSFLNFYSNIKHYSQNLRFIIQGEQIDPLDIKEFFNLTNYKTILPMKGGKPVSCGIFGLAKNEYPISQDLCGILLCTYGKVIKADFFNQFPGNISSRILGIVEVPGFINFLTAQKTDFTKKGQFKKFESLRSPIRQEFIDWLREIGVESTDIGEKNEALRLEKELRKIIDDIPEIADFFGFWSRRQTLTPATAGEVPTELHHGIDMTFPNGKGEKGNGAGFAEVGEMPGETQIENVEGENRAKPISRTSKKGPKIGFANEKGKKELAWVEGNNVVINIGHPLYEKVKANTKATNLFYLFAIACAIQRFKGSDESENPDFYFIDRMMAAWGSK